MNKTFFGSFLYGKDQPVKGEAVACFTTWWSGKSSLYLASVDGQDTIDRFIEDHFKSGHKATLRTFDDEFDASIAYNQY